MLSKKVDFDYDVIILGGGSAGIVSGVMAGSLGLSVLLIEKRKMGGECLNTGCVPSKALIHAAKVASLKRRAGEFGFRAAPLNRADASGVLRHVRSAIDTVREADATEQLLRDSGVEIRIGDAHFQDEDTLICDGQPLRAEHFILATGSRPARPPIPGLWEAGSLTNEEIFSLDEIPDSLAVIGGGPLGLEMAQAFHRLGSQVILIEGLDRLLTQDDAEVACELEKILRQEGLDIHLNTTLEQVEGVGDRKRLHLNGPRGAETVEVAQVLVAVGRKPNVEGLNLEAAGVKMDREGVVADDALHTTGRRVWACGDVTGRYPFSHVAEYTAKLVAQNLFLPVRQRADFRSVPWATFTDPEAAHLGLTEDEARAGNIPFEVHCQPFTQDDRALVDGEGVGFVKILSAAGWSGKILGVHILGPRAGELIQEWVIAMRYGLNIRQVADAIHVYPTLTVASQRAAQRWYEKRSQEPRVQTGLAAYRRVRPAIPSLVRGLGVAAAAGVILAASKALRRK